MMTVDQSTRVSVVGGINEDTDREEVEQAGLEIGTRLGTAGHTIVVCSAHHESAVDPWVVEGFARTEGNCNGRVRVYHPLDLRAEPVSGGRIEIQWKNLINRAGVKDPIITVISEAVVRENGDLSSAFLLCQLKALVESTDAVVALGGQQGRSASQVLQVARKQYPIVPFSCFAGAAALEFSKQEQSLRDSELTRSLVHYLTRRDGVARVADLVDAVRRSVGMLQVFLSYPYDKNEVADHIEAFLRRQSSEVSVFRDEVGVRSGDAISDKIQAKIQSCDVFLAIWCAEYASSPYCFDEMQFAQAVSGGDLPSCVHILRIDETRPVWLELRKKDTHEWRYKTLDVSKQDDQRTAIELQLGRLLKEAKKRPGLTVW
jgi:TIR domain-containing protein